MQTFGIVVRTRRRHVLKSVSRRVIRVEESGGVITFQPGAIHSFKNHRSHAHTPTMALVVLWFVVIALVHYQATAVTAAASVMRDSTCYSTLFGQAPPPYPNDVTAYQSAANVWANLDAFDALYISYYSCAYVFKQRL
jgi:hypothetical protein